MSRAVRVTAKATSNVKTVTLVGAAQTIIMNNRCQKAWKP
jgi:hypothetical protein